MPLVVEILCVDLASCFQIFIKLEKGSRPFRGQNETKRMIAI